MLIKRVAIKNYSCFGGTGWIDLRPGINLIVGQNNVGKSAFISIFDRNLPSNKHRDEKQFRIARLPQCEIDYEIVLSSNEIEDMLLSYASPVAWAIPDSGPAPASVEDLVGKSIVMQLVRTGSVYDCRTISSRNVGASSFSRSVGLFPQAGVISIGNLNAPPKGFMAAIDKGLKQNIFLFGAERYSVGACGHCQPSDRLQFNAANLPSVLQVLKGERGTIFDKLVAQVRDILSTVGI